MTSSGWVGQQLGFAKSDSGLRPMVLMRAGYKARWDSTRHVCHEPRVALTSAADRGVSPNEMLSLNWYIGLVRALQQ